MKKSGLADSPFFSEPQKNEVSSLPAKAIEKKEKRIPKTNAESDRETKKPSDEDTTLPLDHDTLVSRYHDTIIEFIRKAVKELGKEAATHRFTPEEKKALADIIYTYRNSGIKTSENEISRIAVNFIIQDYKENGKSSILDKVLRALNG